LKTYLTIWFSSEGSNPSRVAERLQGMGFKPIKGQYDHVYDWKRDIDIENILMLCDSVHETLKGFGVLYKIETV
jgi:hypothetical protein